MAEVSALTLGVVGDGTTNDSTNIATAQSSIGASDTLLFPATHTYLVGSMVTITRNWRFESGAKIKKSATFTDLYALTCATAGLTVNGLELDGNRTGGAAGGGIRFNSGGANTLLNANVYRCKGVGVYSTSSGTNLRCINSQSNENDGGAGFGLNGDGFYVDASGKMTCIRCTATENNRWGFCCHDSAGTGNRYEMCTTQRNANGFVFLSNSGVGSNLTSIKDNHFGFKLGKDNGSAACTGWVLDGLVAKNTGSGFTRVDTVVVSQDNAATGLETYGAQNNTINSITAIGPQGYGLALASNTAQPSSNNRIRALFCYGAQDPAMVITGNAANNTIDYLYAQGATVALSVAETAGTPTGNYIRDMVADSCTYGIVRVGAGTNNRIGNCVGIDCYNINTGVIPALLYFYDASLGTSPTGNTVSRFQHTTVVNSAPNATFQQGAGVSGNNYWT